MAKVETQCLIQTWMTPGPKTGTLTGHPLSLTAHINTSLHHGLAISLCPVAIEGQSLRHTVICNQSGSSGSWGLRPQIPARQNNSFIVVLLLRLLLFRLKN